MPEVTLTGIKPLIEQAQMTIFQGFQESFSASFLLIAVVSWMALRSIKLALIAMIPKLCPRSWCLVMGGAVWSGYR